MERRLRDSNNVFPPFSALNTASLLTDQQIGLDFFFIYLSHVFYNLIGLNMNTSIIITHFFTTIF